jgi:hypothetical protein
MKSRTIAVLTVGATGALALTLIGHEARGGEFGRGVRDIALCQLFDTSSWGRAGDIHAFSIQTDTWNVGDENLRWEEFTPFHPVMAQNLYRYRDGRFEQIGLSWIKHGFCALQQAGCGDCFVQGGCLDFLGVGCRDPYSSNLNGQQQRLGPRSEVNASTSEFPYPFTLGWEQEGDEIFKRIQVQDDDLDPLLNAGARYYIEGQILHAEEGASERRHNNATHEEVFPVAKGDTFDLGLGEKTVQLLPAIYAWQDNDPDVVIETVDADGRFHVAHRVYDNRDGTWRYEYAVHNLNSHRSARGFAVPIGSDANVLETFHRDVKYHSGEVYTNEDWTLNVGNDAVSWTGMTFAQNADANALRWGTMFNFSIVTDAPPVMGEVTLTLFRPGEPSEVTVSAMVPGQLALCAADFVNESFQPPPDGVVDGADLAFLLGEWGPNPGSLADIVTSSTFQPPPDGIVDAADLAFLLGEWGACP